jgi:hypothetical protein
MRPRIGFFLAIPLFVFGLLFGSEIASSQDARNADASNDPTNKINFGLFNWKQYSDGNMVASFVMSNYGDRDIRELTITCDYTLSTSNSRRNIEYTLKDDELATRLEGEFLMRAHTGRHYTDINFGSIDPVQSIRYMACGVSNVKF